VGAISQPPAAANQARLTERNRRIAEAVDGVADQLGASPIGGVRTPEQLEDVLGRLDLQLPAEHLAELDEVSRIELGFPDELLMGPQARWSTATWSPRSSCQGRRRSAGASRGRSPSPSTLARRASEGAAGC
jgi:hypothetical protein